jgi:flagellar motor protein MotB
MATRRADSAANDLPSSWARCSLIAISLAAILGCQSGPFSQLAGKNPSTANPLGGANLLRPGGLAAAGDAADKTLIAQAGDFKATAAQLERLNADLTSQLADARKSYSLQTDRLTMLQEELNKMAIQARDAQLARLDTEKRLQTISASTRSRAGASITANSSARGTLRPIQIPGTEVRQEGDLIRIAIPSDQLFKPGSDQLIPNSAALLEGVARSVSQAYPRQLMGSEAFTDGGVSGAIASPHQLTAAQATALLHELTGRYRMPAGQFNIVGHGANISRSTSSSAAELAHSRRIEIVIYPETVN